MESLRKGSRTFFRIGPATPGELTSFAVTRGDINTNANAIVLHSEHYGELKALSNCTYPLGVIGDMLATIQDGLHGTRRYVADGVPLLGVGNVTEDGIDLSDVNRITPEEHRRLAASHVKRGDLLVTITGRPGTAAIYDSDEPANLSAHVALCRSKQGHELLYLKYFLSSRFGAASLTSAQIGSTHPHINVRRLAELPIPLPPQSVQVHLAGAMQEARAARKQKIDAAAALLDGLNEFLNRALGVSKPAQDGRSFYAVSTRDAMRQGRLNADYFHPERLLALRAIEAQRAQLPYAKLSDVVSFIRDQLKSPGPNYLGQR